MTETVYCLDTSVLIQYLTGEEHVEEATRLVLAALEESNRCVAPAWAWAEVGSVLRKKVRAGLLREAEAEGLWKHFTDLPIEFIDEVALRMRAWDLAGRHSLPTLYDAAFLARVELADPASRAREFWTADRAFVGQLGESVPDYVHLLAG